MADQQTTQTPAEAEKSSTPAKEKSSTPAKGKSPTPAKGKSGKTRKSHGKGSSKMTLEQAQKAAQSQIQTRSASMTQIVSFLSQKKNAGNSFSPGEIAAGIGNGASDRDVRKALQKKGLAGSEGKTGVIQTGDFFLYLTKEGNRNRYRLLPQGTPPPAGS